MAHQIKVVKTYLQGDVKGGMTHHESGFNFFGGLGLAHTLLIRTRILNVGAFFIAWSRSRPGST